MNKENQFTLIYHGGLADENMLDLYDASQSYHGLARTLAIIGHYYITGEIISRAPSSEMPIYIIPPEAGSFKQSVAAGAIGGIISASFVGFASQVINHWIPSPDPELQQIITLLQQQNKLLMQQSKTEIQKQQKEEKIISQHINDNQNKIQMIRSITSNSFKSTFRPIGQSAKTVSIISGKHNHPIGAMNEKTLARLDADAIDEEDTIIVGIVNSFSKTSKVGHIYVADDARSYRFEYQLKEKMPAGDIFSWSQYRDKKIKCTGRFVRFYDGKIKKYIVFSAEKLEEFDDILLK